VPHASARQRVEGLLQRKLLVRREQQGASEDVTVDVDAMAAEVHELSCPHCLQDTIKVRITLLEDRVRRK